MFVVSDMLNKPATDNTKTSALFPAAHLAQMENTVRLHLNAVSANHVCMEDVAKTLVQA